MTLGQYLKQSRRKKRFKAYEVAKYLGIRDTELSRYENDRRIPMLPLFIKMAVVLDLDFSEIKEIYNV